MKLTAVVDTRGDTEVHLFDSPEAALQFCLDSSAAEGYDFDPNDPALVIVTEVEDHRL